MKKRILSIALVLCMLLSVMPMTTVMAADDTTELQEELYKGGTVTLSKDYVITSTLIIRKDVTLDLNGYVLKKNSDGGIIKIRDYKTLTLNDSNPTRTHTGDFSSLPAGGLLVGYSETDYNCTGVSFDHAVFIMNGGTIMNCAAQEGGGVKMGVGCEFIMNGGTIRDCSSARLGGGVCMYSKSKMSMNGGTIENCSSSGTFDLPLKNNISVCFISECTFYANGGVIKGVVYDNSITDYISKIDSTTQDSYTAFYDTFRAQGTTIKAGVFYGGIVNNCNFDSPYYTVSFDLDGGSGDIPTQYFVNTTSAKALKPTAPTKDGYAFLGWYNGNAEYKFDKPVTANISLKAKWESINVSSESELKSKINSGVDPIKLSNDLSLSSTLDLSDRAFTLDLNGHVLKGNINIADTSSSNKSEITLIDSNPTATHSDTSLPLGGVVKGNITLSRGNGGANSVLNADGGSVTGSLNLHSYAAKVCTSCDNKTTTSFYGNVNVAVTNAEICTGIYYKSLSQNFKSSVKGILLTFYVDGNEYCNEVYTQFEGSVKGANTVAPVPPTKNGYAFANWKYESLGSAIDWPFGTYYFILPGSLYAAFTIDTYTINYDLNGGNLSGKTNPTSYNSESDSITLNNPTKNGYDFIGWSGTGLTGENNMTVTIPKGSTGERTYTANYSAKGGYKVSFDTNGGSAVEIKENVNWTDSVLENVSTTRTGFKFKGWKCVNTDVTDGTTYGDLAVDDTTPMITLTVQWEDITPPTGEIAIGSSSWKTLLNNITFGLFFRDTEEVTIAAEDNSGEEVTIEYLLSNGALSETDLESATFTAYTDKFTVEPNNEYVVYAKLTDKAGNVAYLSSDGIVLDNIAPVISGIEDGKTYCNKVTFTVSDNSEKYTVMRFAVLQTRDPFGSVLQHPISETLMPNANGEYTLTAFDGTQTIGVCDYAGNKIEIAVTVNDGHTGGTATCTEKAVCEVCGTPYGEVDGTNHEFTAQVKNADTLKSAGTCQDKAVYYFSCSRCGEIDTHTFEDELDSSKHTDTKEWSTKNEMQHKQTWKCCGAVEVALENHEWKDGVCEECGYICLHTGGTADCTHKAVCTVCGEEYGKVDSTKHTDTKEWSTKNETQHKQTWKCCGAVEVALENHEWKDGVCEECGYVCLHAGGTATCVDKAKCEVCGEEYGEINTANHTMLKHIEAKAATVTETGNTEYWHCEECGKYFVDKDCKNEIDLKDTVIGKLPPEIIDGKGQSITEGEKKELTFRSNGAYSDFIRVEVDGKTVDGKNYTAKEGSTLVTLKADYVATLSAGEHTLGIVSESGTAETTFTVNAKAVDTTSPQTGDNSHMVLWTVLLLVSGGAFVCTVAYGKKRKYSAK